MSYDDREIPFDLGVVVPLHGGAAYVDRSPGLGDERGFVPVDPRTLQHPDRPEVFAIGDAAGLPASKAGSVALDQALLIDFDYDTEPLPGHFPGAVGLPLLKESYASHLGKPAFEWLYWHALPPGHELPGIRAEMPEQGTSHSPA
ncbi:hypothetical protein [Streptomyces sp. NPDC057280]|uniref:hypothetical protein n=1 Tax=Streptomyces sp. NPDC057280 TaxID=3346081 RepID=UPI0036358CD4